MAISWGKFDEAFIDELVSWIGGRSVLEVFAGNGLLAAKLAAKGVDVIATSLFRGHDGHSEGMHFEVIEMRAHEAARRYRDRDIMLMSWPTADEGALHASLVWGEERPLVFIGEVTDLEAGRLGGCASDTFFELSLEKLEFRSYRPRNMLERAAVRELKPGARLAYERTIPNVSPAFGRPAP